MNAIPKFLTLEDLQQALSGAVSVRTLQRMAQRKEIPGAIRIGRKYFFQPGLTLPWIEGLRDGAET